VRAVTADAAALASQGAFSVLPVALNSVIVSQLSFSLFLFPLSIISHPSTRAGSPPSVSRILGELLFHLICRVLFTLHFSVSSAEFFRSPARNSISVDATGVRASPFFG